MLSGDPFSAYGSVENCPKWKETEIKGSQVSIEPLWEEEYLESEPFWKKRCQPFKPAKV